MERYCPPRTARFVPGNKISPRVKRVHQSFLSPKLFSAKVKRFFAISLSLWNQKELQQERKQREQKLLISFKNRETQKFILNLKNRKFEFEI